MPPSKRSKVRGSSGSVGAFGSPGSRPLTLEDVPDRFGDAGRREWGYLVAEGNPPDQPAKLLITDRALAEHWCDLRVDYLAARARITEMNLVLKKGDELVANKYFDIAHRCQQQLRLLAVEMGLSPASRPRVHRPPATVVNTEPSTPPPPDPFAGLRLVG